MAVSEIDIVGCTAALILSRELALLLLNFRL
jgi:hypothetical protein